MRKILVSITGIIVLVTVVGSVYLFTAYPAVSPAPDITVNGTAEQVSRGKYLAEHVAVCIDCHSTRNWSKFSGPIVEGTYGKGGNVFNEEMGLPGTFFAKNITPYNLLDWTDGEIYRTITTGVTKEGRPMFPLMPYQAYSKMDPDDVRAIIAYIRTLKPIEYVAPPSEANFPMNLILRTIPGEADPMKRPSPENTVSYGKYLTLIGGCSECHTLQKQSQKIEGMFLAGGFEYKMPFGTIRSSNITPDEQTGIGKWTRDMFVDRFKQFDMPVDSLPDTAPGQFNSVMPWQMYAGMDKKDLEAIYSYLQSIDPVEHKVVKFSPDPKPEPLLAN